MRIDAKSANSDLIETINQLIVDGAVIDILTSDLTVFSVSGLRLPTVVYRPGPESMDHIWLLCPVINTDTFDRAMNAFNKHWDAIINDPFWQNWIATHPVPADVLDA